MNPYSEENVRSQPWGLRATIEPRHSDRSLRTLTLGNCEVDVFEIFDPALPEDSDESMSLAAAIGKAANKFTQIAAEEEAGRWISDHEVIYLVTGNTGKQSWVVKAFLSEERASDLQRDLNQWCRSVRLDPEGTSWVIDPVGMVAKCPYDPKFRVEENGVQYTIETVPLDMFDPIRG